MKQDRTTFIFDEKISYKDLAPVYTELYKAFLVWAKQEDSSLLELDLNDLKEDRKPAGYIRNGSMKLIFPILKEEENIEFYIYNKEPGYMNMVIKDIGSILKRYNLKHEIKTDSFNITPTPKKKKGAIRGYPHETTNWHI